jgi:hypothetical protein
MLRKRDREALAVALGLAAVFALIAKSSKTPTLPQPIWFGIPGDWCNYIAAAQEDDMLCWAASIQMILKRYGVPTTQSQIVTNAYHAPMNLPGTDEAISKNLNGFAFTIDSRPVSIRSRVARGFPPIPVLLAELRRHNPLLLAYDTGASVGHAVVVTGAEFVSTTYGPFLTALVYRDPSPTPGNVANNGRVELRGRDLQEFMTSARSHWFIQVRRALPKEWVNNSNATHRAVDTE